MNITGMGEVEVGKDTVISPDAQFIFHKPAKIKIGDYCVVGAGVKFLVNGGDITIQDWTSIHDGSLLLSGAGLFIGQHCWFGQYSVLDGTGGLKIGSGVRVGMYSQIWSHVAAGEQIEGCTLFGERPVSIGDDVWLVGSCVVASGVDIGKKTIALIGSNITKSQPENIVIAGSPATKKENLNFYKVISLEEKWTLLLKWLRDLSHEIDINISEFDSSIECSWMDKNKKDLVVFVKKTDPKFSLDSRFSTATICCISSKKYTKRLTNLEYKVLKYLAGNKARFLSDGGSISE